MIQEKIQLAKDHLINESPFYATLLLSLEFVRDERIPTFCVNSRTLRYNPEFAENLSVKTIKVVLHHKLLHLVFKHHLRESNHEVTDWELWNVAGDLAINSHLYTEKGFPEGGLVPGRGEYRDLPLGLTSEEYYDRLKQENSESEESNDESSEQEDSEQNDSNEENSESEESNEENSEDSDSKDESSNGNSESESSEEESNGNENSSDEASDDQDKSDGNSNEDESKSESSDENSESESSAEPQNGEAGSGTPQNVFGEVEARDGTDEVEETSEQEAIRIDDLIIKAASASKSAGVELPREVKGKVDDLIGTPKIDYKTLFRRAVSSSKKKTGINWRKPSRRVQTGNYIMPSRRKKAPGNILFVMDTSGSMMNRTDMEFTFSELQGVLDNTMDLDIWQFGTSVVSKESYTKKTDPKEIEIHSGGGTKLSTVMDELDETQKNYKLIVVLSDMFFEYDIFHDNRARQRVKKTFSNTIWISTSGKEMYCGYNIDLNSC